MAEDRRRFPCPVCGEALLKIGQQCGFCRSFCTEARVREAEIARKKSLLAGTTQLELEVLA